MNLENVERLRNLLQDIAGTEPSLFNMQWYVRPWPISDTDEQDWCNVADMLATQMRVSEGLLNECNTACCIGGWAAMLSGAKLCDNYDDPRRAAQAWLGLSATEAHYWFHGEWAKDYESYRRKMRASGSEFVNLYDIEVGTAIEFLDTKIEKEKARIAAEQVREAEIRAAARRAEADRIEHALKAPLPGDTVFTRNPDYFEILGDGSAVGMRAERRRCIAILERLALSAPPASDHREAFEIAQKEILAAGE